MLGAHAKVSADEIFESGSAAIPYFTSKRKKQTCASKQAAQVLMVS
jgi:hypothetical protein